jgi:hypothetical protein
VSEIVPSPNDGTVIRSAHLVLADLERFELVVQAQLSSLGLPSNQVFVDIRERHTMLSNVSGVLQDLQAETLGRSHYISKMIAAATVGLFDAALNYLWDELVNELRRRVAGFDLKYFYDIAAVSSDLHKHLKDESDLNKIDDASLLRGANEIGLLTNIGFQRLDHIRFMRNHASAAHPNQVTVSGLDLANWLQICIREVITIPPDTVTAQTGRLLANVKKDRLEASAVAEAAVFFDQLPKERADTLANGFFGLYIDSGRDPIVADNVRTLWPKLWPFVTEETRSSYGLRHARARASADTGAATAARELIDLVDGAAYLTTEVRAVELNQALEDLAAAHRGMNNFYNEAAPARRVETLIGQQGDVPAGVRTQFVRVIVEMFLGNGYGISWAADPIYRRLLQKLDGPSAGITLRLFMEPVFSSLLWSPTGATQWEQLLDILEPKLTSRTDRALMAAIRAFTGSPDKLYLDSNIKNLVNGHPSG